MSFLQDHPFAVEAHFKSSTVLTFALPKVDLESFIPPRLELDSFQDKWAFLAIAMVETKHLRPQGFPKLLGNDFFLIGYRIFVRYTNSRGKRLRGLYILESQTNKKKMEYLGNLFTHYQYSTTDIGVQNELKEKRISSTGSAFDIRINTTTEYPELPSSSPFSNWREARRFAGPLPFTFTFKEDKKQVLIIEGVRQNWTPQPLQVEAFHFGFLERKGLEHARLANAFEVKNIPYYWKKGQLDTWK